MTETEETSKPDDVAGRLDGLVMPQQTIYEHGGSRIWIEREGGRELLADTYGDENLAVAVMEAVEAYLRHNAAHEPTATDGIKRAALAAPLE